MCFFKEIADFCRFFWKTPKAEKRIVFYTEHEGYYPYFEGILKGLVKKHELAVSYVTSAADDPILQRSEPRLKTFYVDKLLPLFMAFVDCKVFVMTLTDLNQFHLKRSVNPIQYVYLFHSMVSTHMMYRYGAFDHYDHILCVGPHQIKEIRKHEELNKLTPKKLIEAGYYRLERIREAYEKNSLNMPAAISKKTILIAPSWGASNILKVCGERLVDILLRSDYKVIVRPHPETMRCSPGMISSLDSQFSDDPKFILEKTTITDSSLLEADVLICDCSGVALEYAFGTKRPVLFLDVPPKIQNPRYKELDIEPLELSLRTEIGVVISPEKLEDIPKIIYDLIMNRTNYNERIIRWKDKGVFAFGHSAEIGAQYISNLAEGKNN